MARVLSVRCGPGSLCAMFPGGTKGAEPQEGAERQEGAEPQESGDPQGSGSGVLALSTKLAQLAVIEVHHPQLIRIGPARHNYVYHLHNASPLYLRDRSSDWGSINDRPWLLHGESSGSPPKQTNRNVR